MMAKTNWKDIILNDCEGDEVRYNYREEEFLEALQQFRKSGGIDRYFFKQGWGEYEDPEDASTWGPKSQDEIDWSGFGKQEIIDEVAVELEKTL